MHHREKYLKQIQQEIEREFPEDPALQQVHLARKLLAKEAEEKGISYLKYLRSQIKSLKRAHHSG